MASSVLAACPPEEVVMFRFWKEESDDAQDAVPAESRLHGESTAPESDDAVSCIPEADDAEIDESRPLVAGDDSESSSLFAGDDGGAVDEGAERLLQAGLVRDPDLVERDLIAQALGDADVEGLGRLRGAAGHCSERAQGERGG